jgi:hypothetical protein
MSDQTALFLPATDEILPWFDVPLACAGCNRTTCRPPLSSRPCTWCGGELVAMVRA